MMTTKMTKSGWDTELQDALRDAARYRWLCSVTYGCDPKPFRLLNDFDSDKASIDAAIDAAMLTPAGSQHED